MKVLNTLNRLFCSLGKNTRSLSFLTIIGMAAIGFSSSATAGYQEYIGRRTISWIGCYNGNNTCFVAFDGMIFGADQGCVVPGPEARWDNGDTSEGKRTYASLLAAYLAGKKVDIVINGCSINGYPMINYFVVVN